MSNIVDIVVGFDQREAVAYHTFVQSIVDNSSIPVRFLPLNTKSLSDYTEVHDDGSNDFIYSRFLVPHLMNYNGWAIYADGDMVCKENIKKLWDQRDKKFVTIVKHDYKTKIKNKYWGNKNENYPKRIGQANLWNCGHPSHKILTPNLFNNKQAPSYTGFLGLKIMR